MIQNKQVIEEIKKLTDDPELIESTIKSYEEMIEYGQISDNIIIDVYASFIRSKLYIQDKYVV